MPETTVETVIIDKKGSGGIAKGIVYTRGGKTEQATADRVILSCNGIGTPMLLFKSGYGPRDKVKNLILENPNVGKDTSMGHLVFVDAVFDEPVNSADFGWGSTLDFMEKGPKGYLDLRVAEFF